MTKSSSTEAPQGNEAPAPVNEPKKNTSAQPDAELADRAAAHERAGKKAVVTRLLDGTISEDF